LTNPNLEITILGTGTSQGVPVIGCNCEVCTSTDPKDKRLRTSAAVSDGQTTVSIDIGPDFRQQMLVNHIDHLDGILLTHEHNDHVSGIDDVRPMNFRSKQDMPIFGLPRVLGEVKKRFPYAFDEEEDYPGRPRIDLVAVGTEMFAVNTMTVAPIEVMHGTLPILGYRFGGFAYITDAKTISPKQIETLKGIDVLVINALRRSHHYTHLNLQEALATIQSISPQRAYLTHISHELGRYADVSRELPDGVFLAYDGLRINL